MKKLLLVFFVCSVAKVYGQQPLELPALKPREELVKHKFYTLSFVEGYELSSWVAYELKGTQFSENVSYKEKYQEDPLVSTGSATKKDYKDAGFILGQLVPVEDMLFSEEAAIETFYYSNIVPQKPAFNKYMWNKMADIIRAWAKECDTLYIVSGPVLADAPFPTFGENKVGIPTRFYKVVLDLKGNRGMGFVVKGSMSSGSVKTIAMSIDKVEEITGIDFFPALPDDLENKIEAGFKPEEWNFEILE